MKKVVNITALAVFLISAFVKPVSAALIIDPSQIGGVFSKYVEKINETVNKVIQLTNQANAMATQGYNLSSLRDIAEKYYKKNGRVLNNKFNQLVEGTKQKKIAEKQAEAENYKKGSIKLYEAKKEDAKNNLNELNTLLQQAERRLASKKDECNRLENKFKSSEEEKTGSGEEFMLELAECKSEVQTLEDNIEDTKAQISQTESVLSKAETNLKIFEEEKDAVQVANKERIEKLNADEDSKMIGVKDNSSQGAKEWDSENAMESYELGEEEYSTFMKNYFYDPASLADKGGAVYENNVNKVIRNRKFLFVNTATHLLQVSATTRRELPLRIESSDKMFEETIKSEGGELGNIAAYSNVRLENAKTLFLYAKLLSAQIQYLAAKDLLKSELKKEITDENENGKEKSFSGFNLEKYILTDEYVKKMQDAANKTLKDEYEKPKIEWQSEKQ